MDAERWERIQTLFHEALDVPAARRRAFLEAECDDPGLVGDVLALLEEDARGDSLLDRDLAYVAGEVLDGSVPPLRSIGPYRVLSVIGQGGMGVVYLAERDDLGRRVAIKVLRDAALSPVRRGRFAREEQTLAGLNHPSIARLYDADVLSDGTPYFVMEYVEGVPLTAYCETHRCTIPERLRLFREVCEAVQYAHRQAVIHRDLKPSNILVTEEGPVGARRASPKLLDFGIVKQLEALDTPADQTQTGLQLMTPGYAAPEQLRRKPVGVYTDVYALGVILYELLTGQLPSDLSGLTPGQAEAQILKHEPEEPSVKVQEADEGSLGPADSSSLSKQAWADLDVLCLTAMRKDPQRRYPTVEALMRDLDHYLKGEPLEAQPDSLRYRTGKFLRRNRQPVAAAALVIVVIMGLVAFYTWRLAEQRNRARAEAEKAEEVSEYLISLFEANDPFAAGTDSLNVRTLLRRGTERAEALAGQPAVQAQIFDVLGQIHTQLSQYDRADALLRKALALRRRTGDDPLDVAETLVNLGVLFNGVGEYDSAEVYMREALALYEEHLPPGHPALAATLNKMGVILNRQGNYEEAEVLYRLALSIQRDVYETPHKDLNFTLNNLAVNQFDQGNYAAAGYYFRRSLAMSRIIFGPNHPQTAVDLANLGVLLDTRGNYAAADSMLTEALRIKRLHLGNDHYETAFTLTQLGGMLRRKGDYDRAEAYLREALAIEERVLGPGHRNTAVTLNHLALTLQEQGDYVAAEPLLRRAVAIFGESVGEQHPYTAITRCHLAHLFHLKGKDAEAERLFRECLSVLEAALPADHDILAIQRGKFGALLVAQSRFAEAEPLLVESYETLRARFGSDHPGTREAAQRLVELYEAWNKPDRADTYRGVLATAAEGDPKP